MSLTSKLFNIANGWGNLLLSKTVGAKPRIQAQAEIRRASCDECKLSVNGVCSPKPALHEITGEQANGCGCPLDAKTMAEYDACPIGRWGPMLTEEPWQHTLNLAQYKRVAVNQKGGLPVMLYNNLQGLFVSVDKLMMVPYLAMGYKASNDEISTIKLAYGKEVLDYNFNAKILSPTDAFVKAVGSSASNITKPEQIRVLWISRDLCPELSLAAFTRACEFALTTLYKKTGVQYQYVFTEKDDVAELFPYLERLGIYFEGSQIPKDIKEQLIKTKEELV